MTTRRLTVADHTAPVERLRRARNLKPGHEVEWRGWRRVMSTEPDPYDAGIVLVRLDGLAQLRLGRNRLVRSRLGRKVLAENEGNGAS